jgi:hypothetical protein
MLTAILLLSAAAALWWPQVVKMLDHVDVPELDRRHLVAAGLVAAAVVAYSWRMPAAPSVPTPAPPAPDAGIVLAGKFVGPTAPADAQMLEALCDEIAACIEVDGMKEQPRLASGVAFDDLRIAAREGRMRGESLGSRQPHVRDAIHQYLDQAVGVAGGPVTPDQRSKWVSAYRTIARAAADVTR